MDIEPDSAATADAQAAELRAAPDLAARAERAGYRLVHGPYTPSVWRLLDAVDGADLFAAEHLDEIAHWLDT
ncbi:hypothetical protein [Nocardia mexicana]|uniref:Uncharacterized protein n=1 Tax=Nocardia mexicana TaxID=279262 RepID=A0A370HFC6_9NOCA|nr:hypothetical protein [Nocardia mexicana]RDI55772.1 hypothetical protein DFR68_101606 [Nocardia mexicana]